MISPGQKEFWDSDALSQEQHRVLELCYGCRLCFNLCPFFQTYFSWADEKGDFRLNKDQLDKLFDLCYLCRLCMVVCPYVPPHEYAIDLTGLVIRSRAVRARAEGLGLTERFMTDLDMMGKLGRASWFFTNWVQNNRACRGALHHILGIHKGKRLPSFQRSTFSQWFRRRKRVIKGKAGARVALFSTCMIELFAPHIGIAAVKVLEKNGLEVILPDQRCCGMPKLEVGNLPSALKNVRYNIASLAQAIREGSPVLVLAPTCACTLKKEYPALDRSEDARLVAQNSYDVSQYLVQLAGRDQLDTNFLHPGGKVLFQVACHLRALEVGYKSRELMALIPQTDIETVEACSGSDGSWSAKKENFPLSQQIGSRLFTRVKEAQPARVVTDCPLSAIQIEQETGIKAVHTMELISQAYGI